MCVRGDFRLPYFVPRCRRDAIASRDVSRCAATSTARRRTRRSRSGSTCRCPWTRRASASPSSVALAARTDAPRASPVPRLRRAPQSVHTLRAHRRRRGRGSERVSMRPAAACAGSHAMVASAPSHGMVETTRAASCRRVSTGSAPRATRAALRVTQREVAMRRAMLGACDDSLIAGCGGAPREAPEWASVRELTPGFLLGLEARDPAVAADGHGRVAITYVTRDSTGRDLWLTVSSDSGATFSPPVRVNRTRGHVASFRRPPAAGVRARRRAGAGVGGAPRRHQPRGRCARARERRRRSLARPRGDRERRRRRSAGRRLTGRQRAEWRRTHDPSAFHGFPALAYLPDGGLFSAWLDRAPRASRRSEPPTIRARTPR